MGKHILVSALQATKVILLLVNFKLLFPLILLLKGLLSKPILKQIKGKFSSVFLDTFSEIRYN